MQQLEKKFYEFEADAVEGTLQDVKKKLQEINQNPEVNLVFVSNLVVFPNGEVGCIIQVKRYKGKGGR